MTNYLLVFFLLVTNVIYSQNSNKEFEGIITYKTTIVLKEKGQDIDKLYDVFGRERLYYFKAGQFKWIPKDVKLAYEIFNPTVSKKLIVDKYHSSDTLFYKDMSLILDSVISVKKSKQKSILNIVCNSAVFTVMDENKSGPKLFRTIYYPVATLTYANTYYEQFKAMGQSFIARYTNAIPLRMELDMDERPFTIVYEATNIEWKTLADNEFLVDEKLPKKN